MVNNVKVDYVVGLDRLLRSKASDEQILDWHSKSGSLYTNRSIKNTLKSAGRSDLSKYMIKEEDISLGDKVKSRMTSREGEVMKIHSDGDTITVKWETGGLQPLSKESVYILHGEYNPEQQNFSKVQTDVYGNDGMTGPETDFTKVHEKK